MANTYTLLASNVLTSSSSMITFNNFNAGYQDLVIRISARTDDAGTYDYIGVRYNNLSTSIYNSRYLSGNGTTANSGTDDNVSMNYPGYISASTNTANTFGSMEIYIPSYAISEQKVSNTYGANEGNAVGRGIALTANRVATTDPITEIDLFPFFGTNFVAGSSFYLYGVFNGTGNVSPSIPTIGTATAGNASASVTFTPTSSAGVDASYTALSTPGSITAVGTASPITVSGLTNDTAYTFQVRANNPGGSSAYSSASNSVTPVDPAAFVSIATATPTGTNTVTFSSIPQTYKALVIKSFARDAYSGGVIAGAAMYLTMNGDTTSNYTYKGYYGNGSSRIGYGTSTNNTYFLMDNACALGSTTANTFGVSEIQIQDYTSTVKFKPITAHWGVENNTSSTNFEVGNTAGAYSSTSAITSLTLSVDYNFVTGTSIALYGVK